MRPDLPTSPNRPRDLLLGFTIGLVLGLVMVVVMEAVRSSGQKQEEVQILDLRPTPMLPAADSYEAAALRAASGNGTSNATSNGTGNGLNGQRYDPAQMEPYDLRGRHQRSGGGVTAIRLEDVFPG